MNFFRSLLGQLHGQKEHGIGQFNLRCHQDLRKACKEQLRRIWYVKSPGFENDLRRTTDSSRYDKSTPSFSERVQFPAMANLLPVLKQLQRERARLAAQLANIEQALSALGADGGARRISPAARRRIATAQKLRWAKWRKAQKKR